MSRFKAPEALLAVGFKVLGSRVEGIRVLGFGVLGFRDIVAE